MTKFEYLMNKSEKCLEMSKKTKGLMSKIWKNHSEKLKNQAMNLFIEEAESLIL